MTKSTSIFDDEDFQDKLLKLVASSSQHAGILAPQLRPDDFKSLSGGGPHAQPRWIVSDVLISYAQTKGRPIGKLIRAQCLEYVNKLRLGEGRIAEVERYIEHLVNKVKVPDPDTVAAMALRYKQERIRAAVIHEMVELQGAGQMTAEKWQELAQKGLADVGLNSTQAISATALYETEYAAPRFLINPKLSVGVGMLVARPKIGKTWLALQLAIAVARGDDAFLGDRLKVSGPVLYFALEDTDRRLRDRFRMLVDKEERSTLEQLSIRHHWIGPDALRAELKKTQHRLVVIDPYLAIARTRKSTTDVVRDDYSELQPLRALCQEFDTTIFVIHHSRKADGDLRDVAIGTTGVTAAVDTLWALKQTSEGKMRRLEITGRDVEEQTVKLELTGKGWHKVAEGVEAKVDGPLQQQIVDFLQECAPMKLKGIAEQLKDKGGYEYPSIANALGKMVTAGLLVKRAHEYGLAEGGG